MDFSIFTPQDIINITIAFIALIFSVIALVYTIKTFILKKGHSLRCEFGFMSSVDTKENYISYVVLENLKDRATVVYAIYVKLGQNVYLELEEFEESPLVIQPFQVFKKDYDPVLFYSEGMDSVRLGHLLNNDKIKKRLIVSTTDGKVIGKVNHKRWSPTSSYFSNFLINIVRPQRIEYKVVAYGRNVRYLIDFTYENGRNEVIPIVIANGNIINMYTNLVFTTINTKDSRALEDYIISLKTAGKLKYINLKVLDLEDAIKSRLSRFKNTNENKVQVYSFWYFNFIGKLQTWLYDKQIRRENKLGKKKIKRPAPLPTKE